MHPDYHLLLWKEELQFPFSLADLQKAQSKARKVQVELKCEKKDADSTGGIKKKKKTTALFKETFRPWIGLQRCRLKWFKGLPRQGALTQIFLSMASAIGYGAKGQTREIPANTELISVNMLKVLFVMCRKHKLSRSNESWKRPPTQSHIYTHPRKHKNNYIKMQFLPHSKIKDWIWWLSQQ